MEETLDFNTFCNIQLETWNICIKELKANSDNSILIKNLISVISDDRFYDQNRLRNWVFVLYSGVPEIVIYFALTAKRRDIQYLNWFTDTLETLAFLTNSQSEEIPLYIQKNISVPTKKSAVQIDDKLVPSILEMFHSPQTYLDSVSSFFSDTPLKKDLGSEVLTVWSHISNLIFQNISLYSRLHSILCRTFPSFTELSFSSHKRLFDSLKTETASSKRVLYDLPMGSLYSASLLTPVPSTIDGSWVTQCQQNYSKWKAQVNSTPASQLQPKIEELITRHYPSSTTLMLDHVLVLWLLFETDYKDWVLKPLTKLVLSVAFEKKRNLRPHALFIDLFEAVSEVNKSNWLTKITSGLAPRQQIFSLTQQLLFQLFKAILSQHRADVPSLFVTSCLRFADTSFVTLVAKWGVSQLDVYSSLRTEVYLGTFKNIVNYVSEASVLRQLLLIQSATSFSIEDRYNMIIDLNLHRPSYLWGYEEKPSNNSDTPKTEFGLGRQPILTMISDNLTSPRLPFLNLFKRVLRRMLMFPPTGLTSFTNWTNRYLLPTITSQIQLDSDYGKSLLLSILEIDIFDGLLQDNFSQPNLGLIQRYSIFESVTSGIQVFLGHIECLSPDLIPPWIACWSNCSELTWKWIIELAYAHSVACPQVKAVVYTLMKNFNPNVGVVGKSFIKSENGTGENGHESKLHLPEQNDSLLLQMNQDLMLLLQRALITGGEDGKDMFQLAYETLSRLFSNPETKTVECIADTLLLVSLILSRGEAFDQKNFDALASIIDVTIWLINEPLKRASSVLYQSMIVHQAITGLLSFCIFRVPLEKDFSTILSRLFELIVILFRNQNADLSEISTFYEMPIMACHPHASPLLLAYTQSTEPNHFTSPEAILASEHIRSAFPKSKFLNYIGA